MFGVTAEQPRKRFLTENADTHTEGGPMCYELERKRAIRWTTYKAWAPTYKSGHRGKVSGPP